MQTDSSSGAFSTSVAARSAAAMFTDTGTEPTRRPSLEILASLSSTLRARSSWITAACRALGINPTAVKLGAFTIGASFAGFAGCFFAARQGFISPESFTFIESAIILAIVVLGGMGSQIGVILAAIIMTILPEMAREFDEYRMLLFGLMMVLMMIWRPQGLLPMSRPHMELRT